MGIKRIGKSAKKVVLKLANCRACVNSFCS